MEHELLVIGRGRSRFLDPERHGQVSGSQRVGLLHLRTRCGQRPVTAGIAGDLVLAPEAFVLGKLCVTEFDQRALPTLHEVHHPLSRSHCGLESVRARQKVLHHLVELVPGVVLLASSWSLLCVFV